MANGIVFPGILTCGQKRISEITWHPEEAEPTVNTYPPESGGSCEIHLTDDLGREVWLSWAEDGDVITSHDAHGYVPGP